MTTFTDQQVDSAMDSAPQIVRDILHSQEHAETLTAIGSKYRIHVDVLGSIAQLTRNLLLGLLSPVEVLGTLVALGIDGETSKKIVADLNAMVFIPAREKMKAAVSASPIYSYNTEIGVLSVTKKEPLVPVPNIEVPLPAVTTTPTTTPTQSVNVLADTPLPTPAPARTMAADMQTAQTQPAIQTQVVYGGQQPTPAPGWQHAAQVHVYVPHPTPSVPVEAPVPMHSTNPEPVVSKPPAPKPAPIPTTQPTTSYASDPYREPIT